jgi:16S rRNA processing protein RimM
VRRAHGVRGGLRVEYFGEDPLLLPGLAGLRLEPPDGGPPVPARALKVTPSPPGVIVFLEGVEGRDAAERLRGSFVSAPRSSLPEPAEDELYQTDLLGLPVRLEDGTHLGEAEGFAEAGGTPLLRVRTPEGGSLLVPWTGEYILEDDPGRGSLTVRDAPGLLDQG